MTPNRINVYSIVSQKYGFIYTVTPKIACSSIRLAMHHKLYPENKDRKLGWMHWHEHHSEEVDIINLSLYKFVFIRNPYDLELSRYTYLRKGYKHDNGPAQKIALRLQDLSKYASRNLNFISLSMLAEIRASASILRNICRRKHKAEICL